MSAFNEKEELYQTLRHLARAPKRKPIHRPRFTDEQQAFREMYFESARQSSQSETSRPHSDTATEKAKTHSKPSG